MNSVNIVITFKLSTSCTFTTHTSNKHPRLVSNFAAFLKTLHNCIISNCKCPKEALKRLHKCSETSLKVPLKF